MCGIAGIFSFRDTQSEDPAHQESVVRGMCDALAHRGPDDAGTARFPQGTLGHRRLSILDLSNRAHQPMASSDARYTIAHNGEIYNFRQLRTECGPDRQWKSQSDTEVLVELFAEKQLACLHKLNGLFAFAIWDRIDQLLYLIVDRFAIKQIYYVLEHDRIVFASEVKALFAAGVSPEPHHGRLYEYLLLKRAYGDETFFRNVQRVPPGSHLVVDCRTGTTRLERWYSIEDRIDPATMAELRRANGDERQERCREVLDSSVTDRLISDAPVGVMCSGGVDSSLLTSFAAARHPEIVGYTARIPEPSRDETEAAAAVCRHLKIEHRVSEHSPATFLPQLPSAIYHNDFPLTFSNSIPMSEVCHMARDDGVKVLLTGEGADEVFGGYKKYSAYRRYLAHRRWARWLPRRGSHLYSQTQHTMDMWRLTGNGEFFPDRQPLEVLPGVQQRLAREARLVEQLAPAFASDAECRVTAFMLADLWDYLGALLVRQDRMGMWASIESRVPYLDHRVVEFGMHLPLSTKVTNSDGKLLLRRLAAAHLPSQTARKPKQGFKGLQSGFVSPALFEGGFFASEFSQLPHQFHVDSKEQRWGIGLLWKVLNIEIWGRIFLWKQDPAELGDKYFVPAK